jgi:DNA-binding LytR/AlgR family response regulator
MKDLRCLVVDDEPLATDVVAGFLERLDIHAITRCSNATDAFRQLQQQSFDLLFLDIEMPQLTGFDLLKSLPNRPLVIITTAYRDYAVEGFEWEALDYLVKPFSFTRFLQTMEKASRASRRPADNAPENINIGSDAPQPDNPVFRPAGSRPSPASSPAAEPGFLFLRTDRQWVRVPTTAILYIESLKDYIRVVTTTTEYLCHQSLTDLTATLPPENFLRVHRSYTVAIDKIEKVRRHNAQIRGKSIPISRANRPEIYRRIGRSST